MIILLQLHKYPICTSELFAFDPLEEGIISRISGS